jgi:hypothetical protein
MGRGWKGGDQFTSNLGPRWTGSYHAKEGFQVSKREWKGSKEGLVRGDKKKQGDCAMILLSICILYIIIVLMLNVVDNLNCV